MKKLISVGLGLTFVFVFVFALTFAIATTPAQAAGGCCALAIPCGEGRYIDQGHMGPHGCIWTGLDPCDHWCKWL